jgi:RNA polymerase sigma-70 factor (ECF subfamily)
MPRPEFVGLMRRLEEGSEEAARELLDRYGTRIRQAVRRKLARKLRVQFDSIDFVQDVWASFFAGQIPKSCFANSDELLQYLTTMAYNKVTDAIRKRIGTRGYSVERETPLEAVVLAGEEPISADARPSQVAMAKETWAEIIRGKSKVQVRILQLLRLGNSHVEIAREVGIPERMVRRLIHKLNQEMRMMEMFRLGRSFEEIAAELGIEVSTARRWIKQLKRDLSHDEARGAVNPGDGQGVR